MFVGEVFVCNVLYVDDVISLVVMAMYDIYLVYLVMVAR